jgi:ABC-type transport system involved in multi-copper enzyme maturation permease subunit
VTVPLAAVNAFGVEGAVRYIRDVALLLVWGFSVVIAVTTSARQVPGEVQRRTILPLLAKPVSRTEVVVGKTFGSVLATWGALVLFYASYVVIAGLKSGYWVDVLLLQGFVLHCCFAMVVCAATVFASMFLTPSANMACSILLSAGVLLFGDRLPSLANRLHGPGRSILVVVDNLMPHLELFDLRTRMIHGWGAIAWWAFFALIGYAAAYTCLFVWLAALLFRRKRL